MGEKGQTSANVLKQKEVNIKKKLKQDTYPFGYTFSP